MKETKADGTVVDHGPRELNTLDAGGWSIADILAEIVETENR